MCQNSVAHKQGCSLGLPLIHGERVPSKQRRDKQLFKAVGNPNLTPGLVVQIETHGPGLARHLWPGCDVHLTDTSREEKSEEYPRGISQGSLEPLGFTREDCRFLVVGSEMPLLDVQQRDDEGPLPDYAFMWIDIPLSCNCWSK